MRPLRSGPTRQQRDNIELWEGGVEHNNISNPLANFFPATVHVRRFYLNQAEGKLMGGGEP
jgi:hypothetical protein